eukprot:SRR837773.1345.p1 GENE.SRR837773.1345~~SRR837773.1345.p1  ORF type:complete len:500 (+),score=32.11 SRR837773.1345:29-1528(+)
MPMFGLGLLLLFTTVWLVAGLELYPEVVTGDVWYVPDAAKAPGKVHISCSYLAVAQLMDNTVVVWDSDEVVDILPLQSEVVTAACSSDNGALLLSDGKVVNVGTYMPPGVVRGQVMASDAVHVDCTDGEGFVALLSDGTVVAWGSPDEGGDLGAVDATNVEQITCGEDTCTARKADGTVIAWGQITLPSDVTLQGVTKVVANYCAFAVLIDDSVTTWGRPPCGGSLDPPYVAKLSANATDVLGDHTAGNFVVVSEKAYVFGGALGWTDVDEDWRTIGVSKMISAPGSQVSAVLLGDGSVRSWGPQEVGGRIAAEFCACVSCLASGVVDVKLNNAFLAAIKDDGSVHAVAEEGYGGKAIYENVTQASVAMVELVLVREDNTLTYLSPFPFTPDGLDTGNFRAVAGYLGSGKMPWGHQFLKEFTTTTTTTTSTTSTTTSRTSTATTETATTTDTATTSTATATSSTATATTTTSATVTTSTQTVTTSTSTGTTTTSTTPTA